MTANIFFWSDPHWFHDRILEFTKRPFSDLEEMNDTLIYNWNSVVRKHDAGYILGDISFGTRNQTDELISRLNGQIHIIRGNHDDSLDKFASRFASYQDYKEIKVKGQKICLFHFPIESWHGANKGSWHLHGHCHGSLVSTNGPRLDVGVDSVGLFPISIEEVRERIGDKIWTPVDHHRTKEESNDA